ncbi:MAG: hypothetical protein MAG453_01834 [Calditrichaeota bacterium]|nr:hypothetical protein [Calditrichota bacterium]
MGESMATLGKGTRHATPFRRYTHAAEQRYRYIGAGDFGGKALGLAFMEDLLRESFPADRFPRFEVAIPHLIVLRTSMFHDFLEQNGLRDLLDDPPSDDRIGHAFQRASFPERYVGDLMSLADSLRGPLAIRSSSRLEDAMFRPFAGVYATKMIPNMQSEPTVRFRKLIEAIKFVWASTWFHEARMYHEKAGVGADDEAMAVILQQVAGRHHGPRFYPTVSGVARSFNYYAFGRAKPEQGVVDLALGLGKHIVDGGLVWSYSPAWPKLPPPVNSASDLLNSTQTTFWSVNLGDIPTYDPLREVEYLSLGDLADAERDGTLVHIASTYDAHADRLQPGTGRDGPRVIDFGPILQFKMFPINEVVKLLLEMCEREVGQPVEIEFAVELPKQSDASAKFSFLQVRPMVAFEEVVRLEDSEFAGGNLLTRSERALGNGVDERIRDVVYVRPDTFDAADTARIAQEIEAINLELLREQRPCLLIGFGRWGTNDPWLGTPVVWSQISSAAVIVEVTTPRMTVDLSQGSHFFHNLSSLGVSYFSVRHDSGDTVDFDWLAGQPLVNESEHVRHVRLEQPLAVKVDGRSARGVIHHG